MLHQLCGVGFVGQEIIVGVMNAHQLNLKINTTSDENCIAKKQLGELTCGPGSWYFFVAVD